MQNDESVLNIPKNILRRRLMVMIGLIVLCVFNALFFLVSYVIKGNHVGYTIADAVLVVLLIAYTIYYIIRGQGKMYTGIYLAGRILFLLPAAFYATLAVIYWASYHLVNYEYIAYAVFSVAAELLVFRFNIKDHNPLKANRACIVSGVIGLVLTPVFIVVSLISGIQVSVTDFSRTVKYEENEDGNLTAVGVYDGLSKSVNLKSTCYTQKVEAVADGAFAGRGLTKVSVADGIKLGNECFDGIGDLYLYGSEYLTSKTVSGVYVLHLMNTDGIVNADEGFFDGEYIEVDRTLVDLYRCDSLYSSYKIQPKVSSNEKFINFETDVYVKTVILKNNEKLSYDVLMDSDDVDLYYYNATKDYKATNEYYEERYENDLCVIPRWLDEDGNEISWEKAQLGSMYIHPVEEKVYKYTVHNNLGDVNDKAYYVSSSFFQVLPTIADMPREGFTSLTYTCEDTEISVLESLDRDADVYAVWTMENPEIISLEGTEKFSVDRVYDPDVSNILVPQSKHTLSTVSYSYSWSRVMDGSSDTISALSSDTYTVKDVSDSGTYILKCTATLTEFGVTYTSSDSREFYITISKADSEIKASDVKVTYDGEAHGITDATIVKGEDTPFIITYTGVTSQGVDYSSETMPVDAGTYKASISISDTPNYNGAKIEKSLTIAKRSVSVTMYNDMENAYAGSDVSALDSRYTSSKLKYIEPSGTTSGLVDGDDLGIAVSGVYKTGDRYIYGTYPLTVTITNPNYTLTVTNPDASYFIYKKEITISAEEGTSVYGESINTVLDLSNVLQMDQKYITSGLYTNSVDANDSKTIAVSENSAYGYIDAGSYYVGYKASSDFSKNYSVTFTSASYEITKRVLTVTPSGESFTYDGTSHTYHVSLGNAASGQNASNVASISGNTNTNAGSYSYKITLNKGYDNNYSLPGYVSSYTIAKCQASVSASAVSMTYTDALKLSFLTNNLYSKDKSGITLHLYTDETQQTEVTTSDGNGYIPAGTYYIGYSVDDSVANNYIITYTGATATVSKKNLTITLNSSKPVYNGAVQTKNLTVSGLASNHTASNVFAVTGSQATHAGEYVMEISFNGTYGNDYSLDVTSYSWSIAKKALTITAKSGAITYGDTFENGVTYSGFAGSDAASSLSGALEYSKTYMQYEAAGTYTITPSGLTSDDYEITYASGTLTVGKKKLTITANSGTITYGESFENGVSYLGFAGEEDESVLTGTLSYSYVHDASDSAGSYTITPSGYTSDNYEITYASGTLTVEKKALTITANSGTITYGESFENGVSYSGFLEGEDESVLGGTIAYSYVHAASDSVGTYTITPSGYTSDNYEITYVSGTLTITQAENYFISKNAHDALSGAPLDASATAAFGDVTVTYVNSLGIVMNPEDELTAGTYTVIFSVTETENYTGLYDTTTITVSE